MHVHAPNSPSLARCRNCNQLGHPADACPQYSGLAVRLLFKEPLSFAAMLRLVETTGARRGYLGHSVELTTQHRKVTLLFDGSADADEATLERIASMLAQFEHQFSGLLHGSVGFVDPSHRLKECKHCNALQSAVHSCPFPDATRRPGQQRASNGSSGAAPAPPSSRPLADPSDRMFFVFFK